MAIACDRKWNEEKWVRTGPLVCIKPRIRIVKVHAWLNQIFYRMTDDDLFSRNKMKWRKFRLAWDQNKTHTDKDQIDTNVNCSL